jgi:predicted ribosome quality control (RQC) complex YloA/Tae2 family protein
MHSFDAETNHGVQVISLERSLSPVENAQRYFDRAKRARNALKETAGRSGRLEFGATEAERLLAAVEQCRTIDELKKFAIDHAKELKALGMGKKSNEQGEPPFRVFVVEGGFEVWAGKSSANNDMLTFQYAKPNDLWFHTRGTSGSHVVLRIGTGKGEPGKKAREQAAAIAAYYSKLKGAGLVPVTMTERRHVRKPRGASPGTVTVERERVLFAKPALPRLTGGPTSGQSE